MPKSQDEDFPCHEPWAKPILRWAGSKRKLLPTLLRCAPQRFTRYVEPFAGSACLFFALRPSEAVLGDINSELISAYKVVCKHPRIVARRISAIPSTIDEYYRVRETSFDQKSAIDRAVSFIYLNRHCFNGVYRTNRRGQFNVPIGSQTGAVPSESAFYRCSVALRKARLKAEDFETCLADARQNDFVYLDPPYSSSDRPKYGEYGYDSFQLPDFGRLTNQLKALDTRAAKFLLSYVDVEDADVVFAGWNVRRLKVRRHIAGFSSYRQTVGEVLVANYELPDDIR